MNVKIKNTSNGKWNIKDMNLIPVLSFNNAPSVNNALIIRQTIVNKNIFISPFILKYCQINLVDSFIIL
jgi:hypothetical protein